MLLKDVKTTLNEFARSIPDATLERDDEHISLRVPLASDAANQILFSYIARRGKGNASVYVWAYVAIWSNESFAEPGYELKPAFLEEMPRTFHRNIIRLRTQAVHEFAFLSPSGQFGAEHVALRPEEQAISWTRDQLRSDLENALSRSREFGCRLPPRDVLERLRADRKRARSVLLRGEA